MFGSFDEGGGGEGVKAETRSGEAVMTPGS